MLPPWILTPNGPPRCLEVPGAPPRGPWRPKKGQKHPKVRSSIPLLLLLVLLLLLFGVEEGEEDEEEEEEEEKDEEVDNQGYGSMD